MQQPKYRMYPSLLDKFEAYLRVDEEVESFFNIDNETGEYKRSPEEIEAELKQSLIDAINRVPFASEAADKVRPSMRLWTWRFIMSRTFPVSVLRIPLSETKKRIPFR